MASKRVFAPDPEDSLLVPCGVHRGRTFRDVLVLHSRYAHWAVRCNAVGPLEQFKKYSARLLSSKATARSNHSSTSVTTTNDPNSNTNAPTAVACHRVFSRRRFAARPACFKVASVKYFSPDPFHLEKMHLIRITNSSNSSNIELPQLPSRKRQKLSRDVALSADPLVSLAFFPDPSLFPTPATPCRSEPTCTRVPELGECWLPRTIAAPELPPFKPRTSINMPQIDTKLLCPGFGGYLAKKADPYSNSQSLSHGQIVVQKQRLLTLARFVHFCCTALAVALPTEEMAADACLVRWIGVVSLCDAFMQRVKSFAVSGSTVANYAQALSHAATYAKVKLSSLASEADVVLLKEYQQVRTTHYFWFFLSLISFRFVLTIFLSAV
jgi:hypothetical protein